MSAITSISEEEKKNIYNKMLNVLGETGLSTKEVYDELIIGFQGYCLSQIFRTLAPLREEINQKLFRDVI